ncbi:MAG TPA: hypothetical protein VLM11_23965 [Streptosporangiaceae bacterium]|nr:hypothetical protein [Streptosporangiaceae bacterium]
MTLIATRGLWQIAVHDDDGAATYLADEWLVWSAAAPAPSPRCRTGSARAVVEVRTTAGGARQRALVGGELCLDGSDARLIRVGQSSEVRRGAARTCPSRLRGLLIPGLPPEYAQPVLDGLVRVPAEWDAGGLLVVDRGAYDEVDSSAFAFELAGGLLALALLARLAGTDLDIAALDLPV